MLRYLCFTGGGRGRVWLECRAGGGGGEGGSHIVRKCTAEIDRRGLHVKV